MCERGQRSLVCSHAVLSPSTQNILWFYETGYWVSFANKDTQQFSFLKPLNSVEFQQMVEWSLKKYNIHEHSVWQKGNVLPTYLIKTLQTGCVWLFFILLKGSCKTSPPNLKSWLIAMGKMQTQKNKSLSKGLVSFMQLLQEKERLQTGIAWH